jgi:prepilin-type N-terminal cleavage/methylation domain-containing protein
MRKMKHNPRRGFTLLEMMISVVIIAVLATIAVTSYSSMSCRAQQAQAKQLLKTLQLSMEQYRSREGGYYSRSSPLSQLSGATETSVTPPHYRLVITDSTDVSFTAQARCEPPGCNLDSDPTPDVWQINHLGDLQATSDDCLY